MSKAVPEKLIAQAAYEAYVQDKKPFGEIAARYGMKPRNLRSLLHRCGYDILEADRARAKKAEQDYGTIAKVAEALGMSPSSASDFLVAEGIRSRASKVAIDKKWLIEQRRDKGRSPGEIAAELGISLSALRPHLRKAGLTRSKGQVDPKWIAEQWNKGLSAREISEVSGLTESTIYYHLEREEVTRSSRLDPSELITEWESGRSPAWIAHAHGVQSQRVAKVLRQNGVYVPDASVPLRSLGDELLEVIRQLASVDEDHVISQSWEGEAPWRRARAFDVAITLGLARRTDDGDYRPLALVKRVAREIGTETTMTERVRKIVRRLEAETRPAAD